MLNPLSLVWTYCGSDMSLTQNTSVSDGITIISCYRIAWHNLDYRYKCSPLLLLVGPFVALLQLLLWPWHASYSSCQQGANYAAISDIGINMISPPLIFILFQDLQNGNTFQISSQSSVDATYFYTKHPDLNISAHNIPIWISRHKKKIIRDYSG